MSRPAPGCRIPVRVPGWVVDALRRRAAASGRSLEQEAGVVVREALPRLAAEAVAERLAQGISAAPPPGEAGAAGACDRGRPFADAIVPGTGHEGSEPGRGCP